MVLAGGKVVLAVVLAGVKVLPAAGVKVLAGVKVALVFAAGVKVLVVSI